MQNVYVPCLKWKAGEQRAVRDLGPARASILPLVEIAPIDWDWANECPAKDIDAHLSKVPAQLEKCWGTTAPVLIDTMSVDDETLGTGQHPMEWVLSECRALAVLAVPVAGTSSDAALRAAARTAMAIDGRGVAIRVDHECLFESTMASDVQQVLADVGAQASDADLIVDVEAVSDRRTETMVGQLLTTLWPSIPHLMSWRSVTLLAGGFPQTLGGIPKGVTRLPRHDWSLYQHLAPVLQRRPWFGDYAVSHPELTEIDPRVMRMSASIRYTGQAEWVIVRGQGVRKHGWPQTHGLAQTLVGLPEYCGAAFSAGDQFISDVAARVCGPGNATSWRQAGTNHHLELVAYQLAGHRLTTKPGVP